jgi:hypothetical protein
MWCRLGGEIILRPREVTDLSVLRNSSKQPPWGYSVGGIRYKLIRFQKN